jgi:hypothetical protein
MSGGVEATNPSTPSQKLGVADRRAIREGALELSLSDDAYSYNDTQFTLEVSHFDGDELVETDADVSGLAVTASQAEIEAYLLAAFRCAKERAGDAMVVRNVAGFAAAAGMKAVAEQSAGAVEGSAEKAALFFSELLASCESLEGVAEEFGTRTLADLMYLQNAILTGTQIDVWPGETRVGEALCKLPSSALWLRHTKLVGVWAGACERIEVRRIGVR